MKKYFILAPFLLSITCFSAYYVIGQKVMPDGTLIEPFGLIPLGYLFLMITIIAGIFLAIKAIIKK